MPIRRLTFRSERGLTLVELLIYVVLLGVVLSIVVGIFISVNTTQKTVSAVVGASNQGQTAANQIASAINNASAVSVTTPTAGDQMLLTRTAKPSSTVGWVCEAWYYQSAANAANGVGSLRFTTSTSAIAAPSASTLATWTLVASAVTPASGTAVFNAPLAVNGIVIVTFSFYTTGTGQRPQLISTSSTTPLGNTGSSPCF